jgi:predicted esterase
VTATSTFYLPVRRTARVVLVGEPSPAVRQLWLACHGYSQLAPGFARDIAALAAPERLVVLPEALNRYYLDDHGGVHGPDHPVGATWMTREERLHEIDDYCAYLDAVYEHVVQQLPDHVRVHALGFSQGAQTIARWAARTRHHIDHVILWGAGLPQEIAPGPRMFGDASLTFVAGERDGFALSGIERLAGELTAAGVAFRLERFAGGHRLDNEVLRRLGARAEDE